MKIYKKDNCLVAEIPLKQKIVNPYMEDEDLGELDNLVGVIAGYEYSLSQLIDMDYKGKPPQEGNPILFFDNKEELQSVCKEFNLMVWEYPICAYCGKAIRGTYTMGEKGDMCYDCECNQSFTDKKPE